MLKFTLLLEEEKNVPLVSFEKKVITAIDNKFKIYTPDQIYYNSDTGLEIMNFLDGTLALPLQMSLNIYYLYNNNLSEIRRDDDSWMKNPKRGYGLIGSESEHVMVLADYLGIPPNFLEDEGRYWDMYAYFYDNNGKIGGVYAVGIGEEVTQSVVDVVDDITMELNDSTSIDKFDQSELVSLYDWDIIIRNMYIPDEMRKHLADEEIQELIEEWGDDEEVLKYIASDRPDIDNEWMEIETELYHVERNMGNSDEPVFSTEIVRLKKLKGELAEQARRILYDREYENSYGAMMHTVDWLEMAGYIEISENFNGRVKYHPTVDYENSSVRRIKMPKWVKVNIEGVKEELIKAINGHRGEEFARYDGHERANDYNGEYYYIYKTD